MLKKIKKIDDELIDSVAKIHTPFLNRIMLFMTFLGDQGKVWFLSLAIILYFKRSFYIGTGIFFSVLAAFISAEIVIKRLVARVRPCHKIDEEDLILKKMPKFYSFPSSHSATSFAFFTASFLLCGTGTTLAVFVIALGISFSRFYLQAHYLTDVLCGVALGIISGLIVVKLVYMILNSVNPSLLK